MKIWKEKAGVVGPNTCWCMYYGGYLHIEDALLSLLWNVLSEYKHDRHLVG